MVCTGAAAVVRPVTHVVGVVQVPLLASLNAAQRSDLCTALKPRIFNAGESIVRKGEPGESFYIVESGTCTVLGDSGQVLALHLMLHHASVFAALGQVIALHLMLHHASVFVAFGQVHALQLMVHHVSVAFDRVFPLQLVLHHASVASGQILALHLMLHGTSASVFVVLCHVPFFV